MIIPTLYIPSFYGDIRLERMDAKKTKVIAEKTTTAERDALEKLGKYAAKKKWVADAADVKNEGNSELGAPLLSVQKQLTTYLKPGRKMVTAVTFSDGKMREINETGDVEASASGKPVAGVAVAQPTRGCPAPDFVQAEIKARGVLEVFLDPEQLEDFRGHNAFVSTGSETGHRYMITSRHNRERLSISHRTLYDLDEEVPLCVHDWSVPAAEEMLALHVMLQLPGHESYLRFLED